MNERTIATAIVLWLSSLGAAGPASAQLQPPQPSQAFARFRPAPTQVAPSSKVSPGVPDYRWEGLAIGAIAVGGFVAYYVHGWCHDSDSNASGNNCLLATLYGALVGATIGGVTAGLLGGLLPKPTR